MDPASTPTLRGWQWILQGIAFIRGSCSSFTVLFSFVEITSIPFEGRLPTKMYESSHPHTPLQIKKQTMRAMPTFHFLINVENECLNTHKCTGTESLLRCGAIPESRDPPVGGIVVRYHGDILKIGAT